MSNHSRRRSLVIVTILIAFICLLLLLLMRCQKQPAVLPEQGGSPAIPTPAAPSEVVPPSEQSESHQQPAEILTPATLTVPERVTAGAAFTIEWTGPDNQDDYITIVPAGAPADVYTSYRETSEGSSLELMAPVEPGAHEVRYVTSRSRTILASAPLEVVPAKASLDAPAEVTLGATLEVTWTGPDNQGDFITIVPVGAADDAYASYANTETGSPVTITAPAQAGQAELRYVSGQGRKVLARRPITVLPPIISLAAPPEAIAGTTIEVTWTGPNNAGDYITLVPAELPDG